MSSSVFPSIGGATNHSGVISSPKSHFSSTQQPPQEHSHTTRSKQQHSSTSNEQMMGGSDQTSSPFPVPGHRGAHHQQQQQHEQQSPHQQHYYQALQGSRKYSIIQGQPSGTASFNNNNKGKALPESDADELLQSKVLDSRTAKHSAHGPQEVEIRHVVRMIKHKQLDGIVQWAREAQAIDLTDFAGNTPLHWAANTGATDIVTLLLRRGANPNLTNGNGATPLHCAGTTGIKQTIEVLLRNGADPNILNDQGKTFADVCRAQGHSHLERLLAGLEATAYRNPVESPDFQRDAVAIGLVNEPSPSEHQWMTPTPVRGVSHHQQHQQHRNHQQHHNGTTSTVSDRVESNNTHNDSVDRTVGLTVDVSSPHTLVNAKHGNAAATATASSLHHEHHLTVNASVESGNSSILAGGHTIGLLDPKLLLLHPQHHPSAPFLRVPSNSARSPKSGRLLCSYCDDAKQQQAQHASWVCEECRVLGDPFMFCNACWTTEHSSRKMRSHVKTPIVMPGASSSSSAAGLLSVAGLDLDSLSPEARAFILLQQHMLQVLGNTGNTTGSRRSDAAPCYASSSQTNPPAAVREREVQTMEDIRAPFFSDAMLELADVREQLEAEVQHSQLLIDTVRLQLLEALELRHRAEVETLYWRKLMTVRRPPQVVIVYGQAPPTYKGLTQQHAHTRGQQQQQQPAPVSSPPLVQQTRPWRNATNNEGVQCDIAPTAQTCGTQTDVTEAAAVAIAGDVHSSGKHHHSHQHNSKSDSKAASKLFNARRYSPDAVDVVHGEKHLPDQPQMLLVRWSHDSSESWVPAYEVAHCSAVVAYLARYDKTIDTPMSPITGSTHNRVASGYAPSPLGEDERKEMTIQLAALRRITTANQGSRDSQSPALAGGQVTKMPPSRGLLSAGFQPATDIPTDTDVLPLPPEGANNDEADDDMAGDSQSGSPAILTEEELVRKYEDKLRRLEERHKATRKAQEEHQDRIRHMREKQELTDVNRRARVHSEYESQAPMLTQEQPEIQHPLLLTKDRHAALVLHKLQEEVKQAEKERQAFQMYGQRVAAKDVSGKGQLPPLHAPRNNNNQNGNIVVASRAANNPTTSRALAAELEQQHNWNQHHHQPPPGPPGEPSIENALNRVLYEQYFYSRMVGQEKKKRGDDDDRGDAQQQQDGHASAAAGAVLPPGNSPQREPRPASLN